MRKCWCCCFRLDVGEMVDFSDLSDAGVEGGPAPAPAPACAETVGKLPARAQPKYLAFRSSMTAGGWARSAFWGLFWDPYRSHRGLAPTLTASASPLSAQVLTGRIAVLEEHCHPGVSDHRVEQLHSTALHCGHHAALARLPGHPLLARVAGIQHPLHRLQPAKSCAICAWSVLRWDILGPPWISTISILIQCRAYSNHSNS